MSRRDGGFLVGEVQAGRTVVFVARVLDDTTNDIVHQLVGAGWQLVGTGFRRGDDELRIVSMEQSPTVTVNVVADHVWSTAPVPKDWDQALSACLWRAREAA